MTRAGAVIAAVAAGVGARLEGKVALVTGAGQGNGRAIALGLAAAGAAVAVNDCRGETAAATAAAVSELGRRGVSITGDVADVARTEEVVRQTVEELGGLDILVNNAGLIIPRPFGEVTEADWDRTFDVNARGLFFCMQAAARHMVQQGSGTIVNISSVAGRGAPTLSPPYAASKAAVISLTHQTARVLAKHGITVNAICPGIIDTAFNWALDEELGVRQQGFAKGEFLRQRVAGVPLGRLGTPEDVAGLVVFLASPEGSYITGQAINVDGGMVVS